ncbi:MAG TPA: hypothetical protein PLB97_08510 [Accumulibacter sp.]|nr:hypothetical protein [Accumulibacter sp.]
MRALFGVVGLLTVLPCQADPCLRLPLPTVSVKRLEEDVALNVEYGYKSLGVLAAALARPGKQILGLTRGNAVVKFESRSPTLRDRNGQWECASPQVVVSYGFSPLTIYVANEFPKGSCAWREIYEHEMRHVSTYRQHVVNIEAALTESLQRRFVNSGIWRGPAGQFNINLQQEMNERWLPYIKREIARVEAAQAVIDTPEEYARVAESCQGEVKRRLRQGSSDRFGVQAALVAPP